MLDVLSTTLSRSDKQILMQPEIAGVILFAHNIVHPKQVIQLTSSIRKINPNLVIAVDQEGGRVQRLRRGFSKIPTMLSLNSLDDYTRYGFLLASELKMVGIDFSFAPVLDIDYGTSKVIGDRAFANNAKDVINFADAFIKGLHLGKMVAIGKHFPGHGFAANDTHTESTFDNRSLRQIYRYDLQPFIKLKRKLAAIMTAHVVYPEIDRLPASLSAIWLQDILRTKINFNGLIISDDLQMQAASVVGDIKARTYAAIIAGCDILLVCNNRAAAEESLISLQQNNIKPRYDIKNKLTLS